MKLKRLIIKPRIDPFVSTRKCCSINKVVTALGCIMLFLLSSCARQRSKPIAINDIIGHWQVESKYAKVTLYCHLYFYRDSTAVFDCVHDTIMFVRYKLVEDTLFITDMNNYTTKNHVQMPDSDELVFDKLKDIDCEQKFKRNKLSTMNFDSSSLKWPM